MTLNYQKEPTITMVGSFLLENISTIILGMNLKRAFSSRSIRQPYWANRPEILNIFGAI